MLTEKRLLKDIANHNLLSLFVEMGDDKIKLHEELGKLQYVIESEYELSSKIESLDSKISDCRDKINSELSNHNLKCFNRYFKYLSKKVFKTVELSCFFEDNKNELIFKVKNIDKIQGDGSPRAAVMAFDLSLLAYLKKYRLPLPEFTLQDYIESVDYDKLNELFEFSNRMEIQLICSVLSSTIHDFSREFLSENTVLTLSSDNKLFKIS